MIPGTSTKTRENSVDADRRHQAPGLDRELARDAPAPGDRPRRDVPGQPDQAERDGHDQDEPQSGDGERIPGRIEEREHDPVEQGDAQDPQQRSRGGHGRLPPNRSDEAAASRRAPSAIEPTDRHGSRLARPGSTCPRLRFRSSVATVKAIIASAARRRFAPTTGGSVETSAGVGMWVVIAGTSVSGSRYPPGRRRRRRERRARHGAPGPPHQQRPVAEQRQARAVPELESGDVAGR